jgi:Na+/proline symporter
MQYFGIDYLIVYAFLIITLIIGFRSGKNIKDVQDYVLANRTFGKWAILLCCLATAKGGGAVIGAAAKSYSEGIIDGVTLASSMLMYVLMGIYVLPKIANFKDCLTLGDLAGTFYGEKSKIITGILGGITTICRAGMELIMLGVFCESLFEIQASICIVIGGALLAIYSAYGGIRSVTATDIFHFLILLIVIPMLAYIVVNAAGGIEHIFTSLPTEKLQIVGHKKSGHYLAWFIIWSLLPLNVPSNPATMQRFLMAKNGRDLMEQRMLASAFNPVFRLTVMLIGVGGFILYPSIEAKNIVPHVIQNLLPTGMKGIAIIGLLAVMMSTINAYLHAVGFTIVHDVIKPICDRKRWNFNELSWMRWATLLISFLAIAVGVFNKDIYRVVLVPLGFSGPLLMFPIFSGILGLKTDQQSFYASFVVTIIAFGLSEWFLPHDQHYWTILITTFANGITFFGVHVLKNSGFAFVNKAVGQTSQLKSSRLSLVTLLGKVIPTPKKLIDYSQQQVEKYGASYVIFGVFLTLNYVVPYFLWTSVKIEHSNTMLILRLIGGVLCGLLIIREKWPARLLPYLPIFWHITILFTLPFTNTIMYLISGGSTEWLVSFMAIIILLFILVDWITALIIGVLGTLLALGFYQLVIGKIELSLDFTSKYLLIMPTSFM